MNRETIQITPAGPADTALLVALARHTFIETYGPSADKQNLQRYIDVHFTESAVGRELADPAVSFFLALIGEKPVGFIKLRRDRKPTGIVDKRCLEIERIYVLSEYQGFSVGSELIRMVKSMAVEAGDQVIWLQVWQQNQKAIQFYRQAGFVIFETAGFEFGDEIHQDFLLRFDLYN